MFRGARSGQKTVANPKFIGDEMAKKASLSVPAIFVVRRDDKEAAAAAVDQGRNSTLTKSRRLNLVAI